MTTIGPSQSFKDLLAESKKANGGEAANVINQSEADAIKAKILEETKGLSESDTKAYIQQAETLLKSEFTGTNVTSQFNLTDGSQDIDKPSVFSFKINGEVKQPAPPPKVNTNVNVTDYEKTDKDQQFTTLKANPNNYIKYDTNGNVTGVVLAGKGTKTAAETGVGSTVSDVIQNDFKLHGDLTKVFPNTDDGAKQLLAALQKLPGNSPGKPSLQDAKDLLNFIHKGTDGKGEGPSVDKNSVNEPGKVQRLQVLLEKCCGTMGEEIRGKNTPAGGDDRYGYATTLQIRALSGAIQVDPSKAPAPVKVDSTGEGQSFDHDFTSIIPENKQVMIAIDTSGSMSGNDRQTLTKYDQVIKEHPSSDLGFLVFNSNSDIADSGGNVMFKPGQASGTVSKEQKTVNKAKEEFNNAEANVKQAQQKFDNLTKEYSSLKPGPERNKIYDQKNDALEELNKAKTSQREAKYNLADKERELTGKQKEIVTDAISKSEGTHYESGSKAALKCLDQMDPKGKEPYVIVQTDEPDKSPDSMRDLIKKGLDGKVDAKSVVFFNPDTKETVTLADLTAKCTTNGKFDESKFDTRLVRQEGRAFAIFDSDLRYAHIK
jgi:hypothetical protein